jgi:hypothetical protein
MAQTAEKVLEFPAGGIADFYMEDHEIEALEAEEAEEEFGSAGIATFKPIAHRMASYGRYGDDTVAHVETGELVVPKALIDQNPKLRDSIFSHLRELGVEDPERYVVGSGANSLNPETGLPEFFFRKIFRGIKKAASKVAKGVSKAVKSVAKVIKKAAPVIIPFALNAMFPGLGAIYSGALGSGIGTLIQGGSLKDAFKSALIGGAIGGATAAIGGGLKAANAGGSFGKGAMSGIQDAAKLSNLSTAGKQLVSGQFGQAGLDAVNVSSDAFAANYPDYGTAPDAVSDIKAQATDLGQTKFIEGTNIPNQGQSVVDLQNQAMAPRPESLTNANLEVVQGADGTLKLVPSSAKESFTVAQQEALQKAAQPAGFMESGSAFLKDPSLATFKDFTLGPDAMTTSEVLTSAGYNPANVPASSALGQGAAKAAEASASGLVRSFAIPGAVALGATAALGGFTPQELDEMTNEERLEALGPSGYDLYMANKAKYGLKAETPQYAQGPTVVPTIFPQGPSLLPLPPLAVAEGGEIFPRRVGGIMPDEGVPGKDSVRAMLMPGEFVMTTDAVRGLGNGNNDQGIRNMYDMMRGLEAKGRAMA